MVMVKRQEEPGKRQATLSAYFFCWWNFFLLASKKKVRVVSLKITESRITIVDAPYMSRSTLRFSDRERRACLNHESETRTTTHTPNAIAPCSGLTTRTRIVNQRKTIFSVIRDL